MCALPPSARSLLATGGPLIPAPGPFDGFILAGGESRRMGRDKALIGVGGRPLISVGIDALTDAASVTIVGGPDRSTELGVPCIADAVPGGGPLVGLLTALDRARCEAAVVLACDLPAVSRRVVANLLDALGDGDAVVPMIGGRPQWMVSAWRKGAYRGLAAARDQGARSVHAAVADLRLVFLLDDDRSYIDIDTPAELATHGGVPDHEGAVANMTVMNRQKDSG